MLLPDQGYVMMPAMLLLLLLQAIRFPSSATRSCQPA
jgi:hypothetical protein